MFQLSGLCCIQVLRLLRLSKTGSRYPNRIPLTQIQGYMDILHLYFFSGSDTDSGVCSSGMWKLLPRIRLGSSPSSWFGRRSCLPDGLSEEFGKGRGGCFGVWRHIQGARKWMLACAYPERHVDASVA